MTRAREQNGRHYDSRCENIKDLSANVRQTFENVDDTLEATSVRLRNQSVAWRDDVNGLDENLSPFSESVQAHVTELRTSIESNPLIEYVATGQTPQKKNWSYPTTLPRTGSHNLLLAGTRDPPGTTPTAARSPRKFASPRKLMSPKKTSSSPSKLPSPIKTKVFHDDAATVPQALTALQHASDDAEELKGGLREMDMNILARPSSSDDVHGHLQTSFSKSVHRTTQQPPLKRHATAESRLPRKGRENSVLSQSMGPCFGTGRRLRSSPQQ